MAEVLQVNLTAGIPDTGTGDNFTTNSLIPVADGAADSGRSVQGSGVGVAGASGVTLESAGDRIAAITGLDGIPLVRPYCGLEDIVTGNASNSDGTSTQVIAAGGAGVYQYLTTVTLTNTSSTGIYVEMKSGTTVKATIPVPANGGCTFAPKLPLPPNAANEAWNFDPSAAASTVYCTAIGFKSKI